MHLVDPRTGIEVLDRDECLRRLRSEVVGRLAVVHGGAPMIYPINFVVDGEDIVFRSDPGSKVEGGLRSRVCFEVDHLDPTARSGWSVVVSGRLEEAPPRRNHEWTRLFGLPVDSWAGDKHLVFRVVPDRITGRQVGDRAAQP